MTAKRILFIASVVILILSMALPVSAAVDNPPLAEACSLNIIFVLDESGSIYGEGSGAVDIRSDVRDAANGFLNSLTDTGSDIAIIEFGTTARRPFDYTPLTSANVTNIFTPYINGDAGLNSDQRYEPYDYAGTDAFYTNWEDALDEVAAVNNGGPVADLVVFFTDGNPTAHNIIGGVDIDAGDIASHIPDAELAADVVKSQGSHMFVIGVPNQTLTHANVHAISGDQQYPDDTVDFSVADYAIATSDTLFESLRSIAFALCEGSVSVTKTIWDGHEYMSVPGWEFSGTVRVTGGGAEDDYEWILPEPAGAAGTLGMTKIGVTDQDGTFTWQWKPYADYPTEMTLNEAQTGVIFDEAICTRVVPGQENEQFYFDTLPITITFGIQELVTCEFRNIADGVDWGDAADSYGTLAAASGPRHVILPGASILGASIDSEIDGRPSILVDGDDVDNTDDEDGVVFPADSLWNDGTGEIDVTASGPGCLNAWVDFNDSGNTNTPNGLFVDQGEHVISNAVVITGTKQHTFTLPAGEVHDVTLNMRFRITPLVDGACFDRLYGWKVPSPYGVAIGGEIEDHTKTLGPTAISLLDVSTDSEVSRLPFLAFAVLLAVSMLVLAHYRRRHSE